MDTNRAGPHWIDMKSMCQALLNRHAGQAEVQHVTIDLSLCAESATVIGYESAIRESLDRLVTRALRVMPRGGRLMLRVERDPYVTVECIDSGRGGVQPASEPDLRSVAGTIASHGGCFWRRRQPGGGTCFIVELRAAGPGTRRAA